MQSSHNREGDSHAFAGSVGVCLAIMKARLFIGSGCEQFAYAWVYVFPFNTSHHTSLPSSLAEEGREGGGKGRAVL
jgi:hypothetical protein